MRKMRKKGRLEMICKSLPIIVVMMFLGVLHGTEFRSPLVFERGPMRYFFEEWDHEDYGLKVWTSKYSRFAHKAFLKHGTNASPLSALLFGKSDFTIVQALPNASASQTSQYYNPFLRSITFSPRVSYQETGVAVGMRWAYPVYKNKGRVGIRAHVPFRRIEMERKDHGDADTDQLADVFTREIVDVVDPNNDPASEVDDVVAYSIRLDFLESLHYTSDFDSIMDYSLTPGGAVQILGQAGNNNGLLDRFGAVIYSPEGTVPKVSGGSKIGVHDDDTTLLTLPADGGISDNNQYEFTTGTDYTGLSVDLAATAADKVAAQQKAANLWLTSAHSHNATPNTPQKLTDASYSLFGLMEDMYLGVADQENVFSWLSARGVEFESETRTGLGDVDIDLFYEHQFDYDLSGEFFVGFRLPTGSGSRYCGNPYKPQLGNGGHFEFRFGGLVAWQPFVWMNVKLDGSYSAVLESEEQRHAAFDGALVKNLGPCVNADVHWAYFTGHLDFNLFHPKTDAISSVIGYELYYKWKDNINFKCRSIESWLGKKWNATTSTQETSEDLLSSSVAEMNTEAIAHKIRLETSFRITKWFELYCGGAYTFAGRNVPRELDGHGGFVVTF